MNKSVEQDYSIYCLENLTEENIKKYSNIARQHVKSQDDYINEEEGFILTSNFPSCFEDASRIYVDNVKNPAYILIVFNNDVYLNHFGKLPNVVSKLDHQKIPHGYVVLKNKNQEGDYKKFINEFFRYESNEYGSKGLWVLIAKNPFDNKKSREIHEPLGFSKIGNHITENDIYLDGIPVDWDVYLKKY
ncbi:MAG: hypothetical protein WDZ80_05045 [Candidatus Paceibacterota bacterium]